MVFEQIDKLKQEYTDKYVVVDESRPELKRFSGLTGMVKTVNMSGRALVEFDGYSNIGWYDIDLDFLKVVDKPVEVEEKKAPAKKPAAKKPAAEKAAPAKKPTGGGMSVEDMLAAARGEKGGTAAPKADAKKPAAGLSVEEMLAAARGEKSGAPAAEAPKEEAAPAPAKDAKSMSVEEMLAAARGEKSGGGSAPAAAPEPVAEEPVAEEPVVEESAPEPEAAAPADDGDIPTDVDGVLAWCREHDG